MAAIRLARTVSKAERARIVAQIREQFGQVSVRPADFVDDPAMISWCPLAAVIPRRREDAHARPPRRGQPVTLRRGAGRERGRLPSCFRPYVCEVERVEFKTVVARIRCRACGFGFRWYAGDTSFRVYEEEGPQGWVLSRRADVIFHREALKTKPGPQVKKPHGAWHRIGVRMRNRRKGASLKEIEAVYRREFTRFLRVATAILGDDHLAEDAIDEAFVGLVRYRRGFRSDGSVEAWAWAAVVRSARKMAARRFASPEHDSVGSATAASAGLNGHSPSETVERVGALVAALPERQRLALFLRHYADLDYQAIADVMGISAGTVGATLHKAHSTLRDQSQEVFR